MNDEGRNESNSIINPHINKKQKKKGPYLLGQTLGEGAFAKVKVATQIYTNEKTAIKILDKSRLLEDERDVQRLKKEINILKQLHHKNIIQLYEIMESKKSLYIVMEYCEKGELFDYIVKNGKLNEKEACRLFQQIINGVEYLHQQSIIHRDLKPENILLDNNTNIKISDFGLSTFYNKNTYLQTPCGTPSYAPPEMLNGNAYNGTSSDIWSCGIILYAMLCGSLPFAESKEDIICRKILSHDYIIPNFLSKDAKDLLNHIMKIDPMERYTIQQIKKHPWFNLVTPHLIGGITIGVNEIPVDENILDMVEKYNFDREKCRQNILNNRFDPITCVYYLCLKKYIRDGNQSVSDLTSDLFEEFLKEDYLRINKETISKKKEIERPKTARLKNKKNISIKNDKSTIENEDNRIKSNGQVEISKTQPETETSLKSNRSYINNEDKSQEKKNDKIKKEKRTETPILKIEKEMSVKSQKNLNCIPILKSEAINNNKKITIRNNKREENEKELIYRDNKRKFSGNSSNNNIFKSKKIDQIKTNLNKNKNSYNNSNPKLIVSNINVTLNNPNQNKVKNKGQDYSSYRQNYTNNMNVRIKTKKNSNIGSSTELSTLIKKKIKEFSKSIVIPTIKESNNNTSPKKAEQQKQKLKDSKDKINNINTIKNKETKNQNCTTLNNIISNKDYNKSINLEKKLNTTPNSTINKLNGNEYNQKSAFEQRETYRTYRNDVKEGRTASQHKSSPFPLDKISLDKDDDESLFLDDEKPVNVLDYIARRLVASSFCGSCNFQSSQIQNNHHDINYNQINKNENSFKSLISILNQKFKNFILKENLDFYQTDYNKNNSKLNIKKNYKNENSNIDYNINNIHYNKFLDISTNYDPNLDSRGESSVERSLSIKSNEFRNFSFSPERKAKDVYEKNYIPSLNLNSSFNGNISSNNLKKVNGNYIGIISEDEEYEFLDKERIKKSKKNKKLYPFYEKKVTINLSMTLNNTIKKSSQNMSNTSSGNLQIKKKTKKKK